MGKMVNSVGGVLIDYEFYPGEDLYSDGSIENTIYDAIVMNEESKILHSSNEWAVLYHLSDIRENIIEWCNIDRNSKVLEIGSGCGAVTSVLSNKAKSVDCVELSQRRTLINAERNKNKNNIKIYLGNFQDVEKKLGQYDVITLIGVLEYAGLYIHGKHPYTNLLRIVKKHLSNKGKIIIAIENKIGLKYLNGAPEDHMGQPYVGINDYVGCHDVRTFSGNELREMLKEVGLLKCNFYYPVPDYKLPMKIYSQDILPKPGDIRTYKTNYSKTRIYNFMEDVANDQISSDGMFEYMSNSFLIIAGKEFEEDVLFAKYNRERKCEYRISTKITNTEDGVRVVKSALTEEAFSHIKRIKENEENWVPANNMLKKGCGFIKEGKYYSGYIKGKTLVEILYKYRNDSDEFIKSVDELINKYYQPDKDNLIQFEKTTSFTEVFGDIYVENSMSYRITNIDLLFSNIIIDDTGNAYAIDFEWVFDFPIPYRFVSWRACKELYCVYMAYYKNFLSIDEYYAKLGFKDFEVIAFKQMEKNFGDYVCGFNRNEEYLHNYVKPFITPKMIIG
ncbi:class I SAM-dependent methyltransferase [Pseudobutyrivibrio xylanivorans]|uniref:Class I SAM-dependent methyltransferase n=1 Tax=Pseudobutyrivibrio xylanivorans TaxID=185007 RepID=A0A5P6VVF5_PSEXY|nr:class I SAM-dependent methyltransferase [Pseudobutyrivibrio xylanivorans]QFJ54991.1 class I SAM-dependent methyltransferase [Pseudobutyrivibrio xylanivorans]